MHSFKYLFFFTSEDTVMVAIRMIRHTWDSLTHLAPGDHAHLVTCLFQQVLVLPPCQIVCAPWQILQHLHLDRFLGFDLPRPQPVLIVSSLIIGPVSGLLLSLPAPQWTFGFQVSLQDGSSFSGLPTVDYCPGILMQQGTPSSDCARTE